MNAFQVFLLFAIGFGIASMGYVALRGLMWLFDRLARKEDPK